MNKNRIGLLTIHDTLNYGSLLQTYATYMALKSITDNVELIDYKCDAISKRESTHSIAECKSVKDLIKWMMWHPAMNEKKKEFWKFIKDRIVLSEPYSRETIKASNEKYDTFIVGSDIVWGTNITGHDYTYFLDFVDNRKKKIAFSSSIGTAWEEQDKPQIADLIIRFDEISVREQLAAEWIKEISKRKVEVTCDPTMLWNSDFWAELSEDIYLPKEKYVLIYLTTPDKKDVYDGIAYAKEHDLSAYYIDFNYYKPIRGLNIIKPTSIQQWISLIRNADTVFTASYHGLLFSLYFHKNLYYYNGRNTSRMISLSKEIGIEDHEGFKENIEKNSVIDYEKVDKVLRDKREYSWNILREYITKR